MPMHVLVGVDGTILHVGPTLAKIHPGKVLIGQAMSAVFEPRRAAQNCALDQLLMGPGGKVYLRMLDADRTQLIGDAVRLETDQGLLINLSFGISAVDAVARFNLAGSDFAATDLTVPMLYLVEAKSAAMAESRKLNDRLNGARAQAEAQALSDTLTGLNNRRALDQTLERLVARGAPFTVMRLDLDFFKAVNDNFGHAAGDAVLVEVARILSSETRNKDVAARVGGDEFVLVFENLVDPDRLHTIATRLIHRIEAPVVFREQSCEVSASVGLVSTTIYTTPDAEQMLHDADIALYVSKEQGRARHTVFRRDMSTQGQAPYAP